MLDSKKRAFLKGLASNYDTILQIGKGGILDNVLKQIDDALRVRELIKIRVLDNSEYTSKEASQIIADATGSEVVQVIGTKIVLFRRNPKEPVIDFKRQS